MLIGWTLALICMIDHDWLISDVQYILNDAQSSSVCMTMVTLITEACWLCAYLIE